MERVIYVQLLDDGAPVWRPVSAVEIGNNIFQLGSSATYNQEDEHWEFLPGTLVVVEEKDFIDGKALVATRQYNG